MHAVTSSCYDRPNFEPNFVPMLSALRRCMAVLRAKWSGANAPSTRLGRWCGRWYNPSCDEMTKGWLSDVDNSAWHDRAPAVKRRGRDGEVTRDPVSCFGAD